MTGGRIALVVLLAVLVAAGAATAGENPVEPAWTRAAQRLDMPVYWPERTDGVTLRKVTTGRPCQNEQVTAVYRGPGVEMWVEIDGRDKPRALRIARSMRLVPD